MRIRWLGHSAFLLTASDGTRIITDPYEPGCFGNALTYGPIAEPADFVTVSHNHLDHNNVAGVPGDVFNLAGRTTVPRMVVTVCGLYILPMPRPAPMPAPMPGPWHCPGPIPWPPPG